MMILFEELIISFVGFFQIITMRNKTFLSLEFRKL